MGGSIANMAKRLLFGKERRLYRIKGGLGKGLNFWIDPNINSQRILGLGEAEIEKDFRRLCLGAGTFVDVGASDGYYPIAVASINREARIIGCEPKPEMRSEFEENLKSNAIELPSRISWISGFVGEKGKRVDDMLRDAKEPILIKIDVDGAEIDVIKSAFATLSQKRCSVILETHAIELEIEAVSIFAGMGYKTRIIDQAWWRFLLPEKRPIAHNRWLIAER